MGKLKMMSPDLTAQNIEKIGELFPNVITEVRAEDGSITRVIDFDLLKQELSSTVVEGPVERYQLDWPGKRESLLAANAPIAKTLRPAPEESVEFETTENLFIEGDNLEALKLLQESYLGKVKMIYIDPPYNTGNDFVYNDDFAENIDQYLERSLQKDEEGNRLVANPESKGSFHSDWLSMMHSRLRLARNLLTDDGVILISIDDNEQANLKKLCDEVFGERNHISQIAWRRSDNQANIGKTARVKEYILVYAKEIDQLQMGRLPLSDKAKAEYRYSDEKGSFRRGILLHKTRGRHFYDVRTIGGKILNGPWMVSEDKFEELKALDMVYWTTGGDEQPYSKIYLHESKGQIPNDFWGIEFGTNQRGSLEVEKLLEKRVFDFPKPLTLINKLLSLGSVNTDDIILDFFAGSSTTAHAVMQLNAEDGGNRKFIMVQLPEATDEKSEAYKAGYQTIAEISKERIRRAGKQILESDEIHEDWNRDIGFRVLKVDSSNMKEVYYQPQELTQADLLDQVDNVKEDRTPEDLLFQVMLDWGLELSLPITTEEIEGKKVFFVADDALIACFDAGITESLVQTLAAKEPLRLLFRDNHYLDNDTKINAEQLVKQIAPNTELKSI